MLKPFRAWCFSTNLLNWSKVTFWELSEASSKLSLTDGYFFEIVRPIDWIAESFQSKVLVRPKPPPREDLKRSEDAVNLPLLVAYGF